MTILFKVCYYVKAVINVFSDIITLIKTYPFNADLYQRPMSYDVFSVAANRDKDKKSSSKCK